MSESFADSRLLQHHYAVVADVLFTLSADGQRLIAMNAAAERLLGYTVRDFLKQPELWLSLVITADRQRLSDFRASMGRFERTTYRMRDRSGQLLLLEECLWSSGVGHPLCGRVTDITQRDKANEQEQQLARAYRLMMVRSRDPMAILLLKDESLVISHANPAWHLYHDAACAHSRLSLEHLYLPHVLRSLERAEPWQCDISLSLPRGESRLSVQMVSLGRSLADEGRQVAVMARDITQVHQRLENVIDQQQRLARRVDETPGAHYATAGEWPPEELEYLSAGSEALTGLSHDLLMASPGLWQARLVPEELTICQQRFGEAVRERHSRLSLCYAFVHVDGRKRYLQDDIQLSYSPEGEVTAVLGKLSDVTQREAHRRQLDNLVQQMRGVVFQCRLSQEGELRYTYLSPVASQLLGLDPQAVIDDPMLLLARIVDREREQLLVSLQSSARQQSPWEAEVRYQHPDGQERRLACVGLPQVIDSPEGGVIWNGYCDDATARYRIEDELRQSEERYRFILNSVSDLVSIEDSHGICQYISPSVEKLCGYRPQEIIGQEIKQLIHPDDMQRIAQEVHRAACLGEVFRIDFRIQHKAGHTLWFESISTPSMDPVSGRYQRVLSVSRNIHERKLVEQRREHEAMTDAMTGAMTRASFLDTLDTLLSSSSREQMALILFDIDHFKRVNDTHGHAAGDQVLISLGEECRAQLRRDDCFARLGGEEFAVLLTDAGTATGVGMAERLRQQIAALEVRFKSLTLRCTISMGVATPQPGETRDGYLHRADMALYSAKRSGRDRVVLASQSLSEDN